MGNPRRLKGANMDIDLVSEAAAIHWEQDSCPWNEAEEVRQHRCAAKNVSICPYFRGVDYPDFVICAYPARQAGEGKPEAPDDGV